MDLVKDCDVVGKTFWRRDSTKLTEEDTDEIHKWTWEHHQQDDFLKCICVQWLLDMNEASTRKNSSLHGILAHLMYFMQISRGLS